MILGHSEIMKYCKIYKKSRFKYGNTFFNSVCVIDPYMFIPVILNSVSDLFRKLVINGDDHKIKI